MAHYAKNLSTSLHDATITRVLNSIFILNLFDVVFASGYWWSTFEPRVFQRLVELYKEVVVYLLQMHKVGIPSVEQRIFTCFLDTSLRLLEMLHMVRIEENRWISVRFKMYSTQY